MKAPSPAFSFYPKDFLSDEHVTAMSNEELGVYLRLLCHAWLEGSIPAEPKKLARLLRMKPSKLARLWSAISPCWERDRGSDVRLIQTRLESERTLQEIRSRVNSDKGKKGGRPTKSSKDESCGFSEQKPDTPPTAIIRLSETETQAKAKKSLPSPSPSPSGVVSCNGTGNGNGTATTKERASPERSVDQAEAAALIECTVADIVTVTDDRGSIPMYRRLVRELSGTIVQRALAETRTEKLAGRVRKSPGALFMHLAKTFAEQQHEPWPLGRPRKAAAKRTGAG